MGDYGLRDLVSLRFYLADPRYDASERSRLRVDNTWREPSALADGRLLPAARSQVEARGPKRWRAEVADLRDPLPLSG